MTSQKIPTRPLLHLPAPAVQAGTRMLRRILTGTLAGLPLVLAGCEFDAVSPLVDDSLAAADRPWMQATQPEEESEPEFHTVPEWDARRSPIAATYGEPPRRGPGKGGGSCRPTLPMPSGTIFLEAEQNGGVLRASHTSSPRSQGFH